MLEASKTWKVLEILNWTSDYLSEKNFESARLNAERLLSYALKMKRVDLYLNHDRPLTEDELTKYKGYLKRRLKKEPLQYILGETEFMSLPFKVNPGVLIPRPETEVLVETVLNKCAEKFPAKKVISMLDIGTGSGCIAIALAKYLSHAQITAIDKSADAIKTAHVNACSNAVSDRIQFLTVDFFEYVKSTKLREKFDVVISNPPYVSTQDIEKLPEEIKYFEPEIALTDNQDGLYFYREMTHIIPKILKLSGFVAVEVGLEQAKLVHELFLENNFSSVEIKKDLNGFERVICCEYNEQGGFQ